MKKLGRLKKEQQDCIQKLIDKMDFVEIQAAMKQMGWKYFDSDCPPSVERLKFSARSVLEGVLGGEDSTEYYSGGFLARYHGGAPEIGEPAMLSLHFVLQDNFVYFEKQPASGEAQEPAPETCWKCGLAERIQLQTEQNIRVAWMKRAMEAEQEREKAIDHIQELEKQIAVLQGTLPGRMMGVQALADEKSRCFLIRREAAEKCLRDLMTLIEPDRVREWWSIAYDGEVQAGEKLFAAFTKMRDELQTAQTERDALALKVQRLSAPVSDDAFDLLMRIVGKLHAILPIVDGFIALQAVRSGNANIYNGPSLEQELKEADALIAARKEE